METTGLAGIDVSARSLSVCLEVEGRREVFEETNTTQGHRRLCKRLARRGAAVVRVAMEPTGPYSLAPALALVEAGFEVMMVNPKDAQRFASLLTRSKTDALDAEVLLNYLQRMPFVAWKAPSPVRLELQAVARRLAALVKQGTQEKNRLHAEKSRGLSRAVQEDLAESLAQLAQRIKHLEQQGRQRIADDEELERCNQLLLSVRGIGQRSAVLLLAELALLPPGLSAPQWVAHAGLDPRHVQSGSSVHKPSRISRCGNAHLRHALYMPALVAVRYEPRVRAFYEELLRRGKAPLPALTAVMRKLLHSLYGMLKTRTPFDGEKFRAQPPAAPAAPPELCLAEPRFVPVALSSFAAETRGLGQGRRSRRSEPLTQTPARQSSPRRRGAITT